MAHSPWWMTHVESLLAEPTASETQLGPLWHTAEQLQLIRDTVDEHLVEDFEDIPNARSLWDDFETKERDIQRQLQTAAQAFARRMQDGELEPQTFRALWESLGFNPHLRGAGTPADDHLDAMFHLSRLTLGEERPECGLPNMASRARRVSDFLRATAPTAEDVVVDLGCGSGKLVLTVAASSTAQVHGIELGASYVLAAQRMADWWKLTNAHFEHADVRHADLSRGTIFYLNYPFHGPVAAQVAHRLGDLARGKDITIYAAGPTYAFGEYFLQQVDEGALTLVERRGEFSECLWLRSSQSTTGLMKQSMDV